MIRKIDKKNKFVSMFNPDTGFYVRSGVIEDGKDTGVDPFMTSFPELLDIGIMQTCVCSHRCNVDCYQKAIERTGKNMSVEDFESIKAKGIELGGLLASNGHLAEATAVLQRNLGLDDNGNVKMFDTLRDTQLDLTKVIVMELEELIQKFGIKTN